jgi:hypothetical protein
MKATYSIIPPLFESRIAQGIDLTFSMREFIPRKSVTVRARMEATSFNKPFPERLQRHLEVETYPHLLYERVHPKEVRHSKGSHGGHVLH